MDTHTLRNKLARQEETAAQTTRAIQKVQDHLNTHPKDAKSLAMQTLVQQLETKLKRQLNAAAATFELIKIFEDDKTDTKKK